MDTKLPPSDNIKLCSKIRIDNTSSTYLHNSINAILSDTGVFAYCAICAVSLHELFKEDWNKKFCNDCLSRLINYLGLPNQVKSAMYAFLHGENCDIEPLINILRKEPSLNGNCLKVLENLILFAVEGGIYDARMRILIVHVACLLRVALPLVEIYEESVVDKLSEEMQEKSEDEQKASAKRKRNKKIKRFLLVGAATIGGGAIIGLTGGLAAPLVAAGAGAIVGGAGAAALGSAAGVAVIGSLFGMAGAGLTGYKMQKRVGDIEEFAFDTLSEGRQLHITLAISGWLTEEEKEAFQEPWYSLRNSREQYCLRYESTYLLQLGRAMGYLFSFALTMAAQEAFKYTILSGLLAAITWPATLISVSSVIDNPWGVCMRRSAEVGRHLAEVLLERQHGKRPITLIGFSLGARVIFYCLQEMAKRKDCEGIIEDAILLGCPVSANAQNWENFYKVVNGRIVNGYCRGDWLLKFLYRTSSVTMKIAGLQAIPLNDRRMVNVDLSSVVSGHMDYASKMDIVLKAVAVRTTDDVPDDLKLKKSHSELPCKKKKNTLSRSKPRSMSMASLHPAELPIVRMHRDRSLSLDSALSPNSSMSLRMSCTTSRCFSYESPELSGGSEGVLSSGGVELMVPRDIHANFRRKSEDVLSSGGVNLVVPGDTHINFRTRSEGALSSGVIDLMVDGKINANFRDKCGRIVSPGHSNLVVREDQKSFLKEQSHEVMSSSREIDLERETWEWNAWDNEKL